ncbi:MAG: peptidylprolyl isomerase [Candidatus Omnitrophota bacterium]
MNNIRAAIYFLFMIFAISCVNHLYCEEVGDLGSGIAAVVNNDVITQADLDTALKSIMSEFEKKYSGAELKEKMQETRSELLNQMIEDELILQEAKRLGVKVEDSEIEERLGEVKSRFNSARDFETELEKALVSEDMLKKRYKDNIMMSKLVTHEIKENIIVTPVEINEYYEQHSKELESPESARVKTIMLHFDESDTEKLVKQKAEDIMRLISEGRDFSDLAKQYSQGPKAGEGGDMGFIEKGQMREEFDKAIFGLKTGEISSPIKVDTGYYIFKVEELKEGHPYSLEEIRGELENIIFRQKAEEKYKEWMKKLKKDAFIQIK